MAVDPAGSANLTPPQPTGANSTGAGSVTAPAVGGHHHHGHKAAAPADEVLLSAAATAAAQGAEGVIPTGTLTAEQLQTITQKLTSGAYDGAAVADRIAGNLLNSGDLTPPA